jgi:hypothetical protein
MRSRQTTASDIMVSFTGTPPAPRSGCVMVALPDGKVLICGGYSKEKVKREVDKGVIHTDMFLLTPESKYLSHS